MYGEEEKSNTDWSKSFSIVLRVVSICVLGYSFWFFHQSRRRVVPVRMQTIPLQMQCSHDAVQATASKDGTHQAVLFAGNCGTPDQRYTWVSILGAGETLADHDTGNTFVLRGEQTLHVRWIDDAHLRVEYPESAGQYVSRSRLETDDIHVQYVGVP
jgi:hypothetical protein